MKKSMMLMAALTMVFGSRANAITILYSDLSGTNVDYISISEDTRLSPVALFGAPAISGDTMDFDPTAFSAQTTSSTGTNSSKIVDGQLNFTIMSKNGFNLTEVLIQERGDYALAGLGSAQATASVRSPFGFSVIEVNGVATNNLDGSGALVFAPTAGIYSLPGDVGGPWSGSASVDIAAFLAANGVSGFATKVEFFLDNTLTVAAADGGTAFIAKKDAGVMVTVPEPSSILAAFVCFAAITHCVRRGR